MLRLKSIENSGVPDKERLVLQVEKGTADEDELDLGNYAIFGCKFGSKGSPLSGQFFIGYWFVSKKLTPGDYVVLYSKSGPRAEKKLPDGTTSHFFYWGTDENVSIWDGEIKPVLVKTGSWNYIKEQDFTIEPPQKKAAGDDDEIPF